MDFDVVDRLSDSSYVESIMHGYTLRDGTSIRPGESHWHMVLRKIQGKVDILVVGPLTKSGVVSYDKDAELLWIKFKLGTFMPHLPVRDCLNMETILPGAARKAFWLKGSAWQFPDFENTEAFVERLVREEVLVSDPVINTVLQDYPHDLSSRTVRHRFLRATGLTQGQIRQMDRARQAATLLEQGHSILDVTYQLGYFDQPHLTRSLRQWVGHTPAQIMRMGQPACDMSEVQVLLPEFEESVLSL